MSGDDWLRALHVLAAFGVVGGLTAYAVVTVAGRRLESEPRARALVRIDGAARWVVRVALVASAALGVWLVFALEGYAITELWILAGLALWFVAGAFGDRRVVREPDDRRGAGDGDERRGAGDERRRVASWPAIGGGLAATAIVVLMIWKPAA
jgi:uncharacterized membrane protein